MIDLIPSFGGALWTLGAFILAISVIVTVHEYGHYIVGRWSGIRADVFSLGFGPVLFSRVDRHGTRWQVAALPLGGYVKFRGDADAASTPDPSAAEGLTPSERRMTMQGAPLWARAATVAAGPVFNFILSVAIFAGLVLWQGVPREPLTVAALEPLPFAPNELRAGDEIVAIDGRPLTRIEDLGPLIDALPRQTTLDYTVRRDGAEAVVRAPHPRPALARDIQPRSAAADIDMAPGDVILSVDGRPIALFDELREAVGASEGRALRLEVWRQGETLDFALTPRRADLPLPDGGFETRWLIGITGGPWFDAETTTPGPLEATGIAAAQTAAVIRSSLSAVGHVIAGAISSCNIRGPVGIAETSGDAARAGIVSFIWFIGMLSTAVGLLNLFPIPMLDGGHLLFHAWEAVTRRRPGERAVRALMLAGLVLLLSLMAFALGNDLFCP